MNQLVVMRNRQAVTTSVSVRVADKMLNRSDAS